MDRRAEIRDFLTSRRARITPERAGLKVSPLAGARRVAGLRREEVALLAGVSVPYYTRLERGDARGATDAVLDAISRALLLDDAERAHLFDLVRAANATLEKSLREHGMIVNAVDVDSFRKRLIGAHFYRDWRQSIGETAWALMEAEVGKVG